MYRFACWHWLRSLFSRLSLLVQGRKRSSRDTRSRCALRATIGLAALFLRRSVLMRYSREVSLRSSRDARSSCALLALLGLAALFSHCSVWMRSSRDAQSCTALFCLGHQRVFFSVPTGLGLLVFSDPVQNIVPNWGVRK